MSIFGLPLAQKEGGKRTLLLEACFSGSSTPWFMAKITKSASFQEQA